MSSVEKNNTIYYDTTLRDGAQEVGVNFSTRGKIEAIGLLDNFGVHYIEGGWPGANPTDTEFFKRARDIRLVNAELAAFGSTRKANSLPEEDTNLRNLLDAGTPVCTLVGKSSLFHVEKVLRTTKEENLSMIGDSVEYLKANGIGKVIFDAEHFFDGLKHDSGYAMETLRSAAREGADCLVLCDTNGGTLSHEIDRAVKTVCQDDELNRIYKDLKGKQGVPVGIHAHNDLDLAVANTLAALQAGATHLQGTINGYGERIGNANILTVMAILAKKLGYSNISEDQLKQMTPLSKEFYRLAGSHPNPKVPLVGDYACAHKAGYHVNGIFKTPEAYEHMDPTVVGNKRKFVISELSGKENIRAKIAELKLGINLDEGFITQIIDAVKEKASKGFRWENADASFELLVRRLHSDYMPPFNLKMVENRDGQVTNAFVEVDYKFTTVGYPERADHGQRTINLSPQSPDVNYIFDKLRAELALFYPSLANVRLTSQNTQSENGTMSRVQMLLSDGQKTWITVGADTNIFKAGLLAAHDAIEYAILHQNGQSS